MSIALEDFHYARRLRVGEPMQGDLFELLALTVERPRYALLKGNVPNCGYWHQQLGRFMPWPA